MSDLDEEDIEYGAIGIDELFPFTLDEEPLLHALTAHIRESVPSLEPVQLREIGAFLHALERLPYSTPGVSLDFAFVERNGENLSYVSVELSEDAFRLSTGGSVYSPDVGSDSFSSTTFEVEAGGFREGATEDFAEWLSAFRATNGRCEIQGHSDAEIDLTEASPGDGWDRLAAFWETHWEEQGGY